jgi:membrane associated rhomboid family serine protease
VGASGAVYGILIAFGLLFPNTLIYLYFLIPIKAKYLVVILIAIEVYMGFVNSPDDNIAHFAHLGGALFGFLLVKYWGTNKNRFY